MLKNLLNKLKPHLLPIFGLFVLCVIYYYPSLEGKVLIQNDIVQHQGMAKEITDWRAKTGEEPLWTNSMFGGMPAFQISTLYPGNIFEAILRLPFKVMSVPIGLTFLILIGGYIFLIGYGVKPWVSFLGAIACGYTTFILVSLEAGHNSKVHAIAFILPALLGMDLVYRKRFISGGVLFACTLCLQLTANHFQITYYLMITGLILSIYYFYNAFKEKQIKTFLKSISLLAIAVILAILPNVSKLWSTFEYAKETMRGGSSELSSKAGKSTGLEKDYAFSWSYGKLETMTLLIPGTYGGSSHENLDESSYAYKELIKKGIPDQQAKQFASSLPLYWGDQPFTSGPVYAGVISLFLFVLGMFLLKGTFKKWILTAIILSVLLSWGKNFDVLSDLFFKYIPMYNKFRTPSMWLTITCLLIPVLGFFTLNLIIKNHDKKLVINALKKSTAILGGLCLLIFLFSSSIFDFVANSDQNIGQAWIVDLLQHQRESYLKHDAIRSLILILLSASAIWLYFNKRIKENILLVTLGILLVFDLWGVGKKYLNAEDFKIEKDYKNYFQPTQADLAILQDTDPNYRVLNLTTNTFNDAMTSYFHKSVGGYHAAKLIKYQDLIENQISKNNLSVLNMLNTKYFILKGKDGQPIPQQNPNALGNAWFISNIQWVNNADEEMTALTDFNPTETVVIDKRYQAYVSESAIIKDSISNIHLTEYAPNHLTYSSTVSSKAFAVFSEIYYNNEKGWNAYIDGEKTPHIRVNYLLRGLTIPQGEHKIEFKFEPKAYYVGENISLAGSFLLLGLISFAFFKSFSPKKDNDNEFAE